jgi:hypothetical protein
VKKSARRGALRAAEGPSLFVFVREIFGSAPPAKERAAADDVEVYANGVAFDVVKGWLGGAGKDLEFDQWFGVEEVDADRPARQERLGLGAKFLSHDKANRLTGGVHKKLGKALARSQRRREEEEEEERGAGSAAAGGRGINENDENDESDVDSDDGGRASASFAGKRKAKAWDPATDPMLMHARGGKKKKKKKTTTSQGGGA